MYKDGDTVRVAWWSEVHKSLISRCARDTSWRSAYSTHIEGGDPNRLWGIQYGATVTFRRTEMYKFKYKSVVVQEDYEGGSTIHHLRPQLITNKSIAAPGEILRTRKTLLHLVPYCPADKREWPWDWRFYADILGEGNRPEFFTVVAVRAGFYNFSNGAWGSVGDFYIPSQLRKG